jgi:hypothetical protein
MPAPVKAKSDAQDASAAAAVAVKKADTDPAVFN